MSIGIITSIKSIKEIIWPNFLTYQKYYDLCRSKVTAPKRNKGKVEIVEKNISRQLERYRGQITRDEVIKDL